ncbi:MAG: carboxypeptidase regulatory-like domain-containing protein [Bryobacteraceae bacterium]
MNFLRFSLAALVALASLLIPARGQEITGNIGGTVTDPTGSVVPNAAVSVTNTGTGVSRTTNTTSTGAFNVNALPVGNYSLHVESPGFKRFETTGIRLDVNDRLNFDVKLEVGALDQRVEVSAAAVQLQTETSEVSNLVGAAQTQAMPLNGRVFSQLVELVPGVVSENGRVGGGTGLDSDTAVSINGNQSNSNLWLVDGQNNMDIGSNAQNVVTPPLDALEEFKVLRNNFSAEFGQVTGGVINVITKQGTRNFHGSVYEFLRNDKLDANDFFLNSSGSPKSELRFNNFGFAIGGPFWIPGLYNKDRTKDFFFASYEGRREVRGNVATDTVPTARQRLGILDPTCLVTAAPCTPQPFDPQEQVLAGEANVPASLIDPNAAAILGRYPLPNANFNGFNFIASENKGTVDDVQLYRWDHNFSEKAMLMVRTMEEKQNLGNINGQLWGDDNFPSVSSDWTFQAWNTVAKLTYLITPHLINDFQVGYTQNFIHFQTSKSSDPTLASRAGFTYTELFPQTSGSFPSVDAVDGFGSIFHQAPFTNREALVQFKDDIAYTFGSHTLKTGFFLGLSRKREPANGGDDDTAGSLSSHSFSALLTGDLATYQEPRALNPVYDRWRDGALYVQDTWKATPSLTLDFGLRWQYLGQVFSAHNNIANFYPNRYDPSRCSAAAFDANGLVDPTLCDTLNGIVTPQSPNLPSRALVSNHKNDWEPRGGIAWAPGFLAKKFVFRTGAGTFHGRDAISQTSALGQLPPNNRTASLNNITFSQLVPGQLSPFNPNTPQPPTLLQALDPTYNNPLAYQYSAGVQYQAARDTVLELDYVGSHQIHQGRNRDINQTPNIILPSIYQGIVNPDLFRPYLGFSHIYVNGRDGTSRYNALQFFANHRFTAGVEFQVAYTWSRLISDTINRDTEGKDSPVQDAFNLRAEKALGNQDEPQAVSVNYIWELPFFKKTSNKLLKGSLGGWELAGIYIAHSGLPQNVCLDHDVAGLSDGGTVCQRPDLIANPNFDRSKQSVAEYFNTNAFVLQQPGTFGNAARNVVRGPGINNLDFSVFKNFVLPHFLGHSGDEGPRLQFRGELFNVLNHTQFNGLNLTFVPTADVAGAQANPSSGFGTVTGAAAPREIQVALKLMF